MATLTKTARLGVMMKVIEEEDVQKEIEAAKAVQRQCKERPSCQNREGEARDARAQKEGEIQ